MLLFVDNLINIDFSFLDSNRGLIGETWIANVQLEGQLDEQGMVCDFGVVKQTLRKWLDDTLDHRLLIPELSTSLAKISKAANSTLTWQLDNNKEIKLASPIAALTLIPAKNITPAEVATWCKQQLAECFPVSVEKLELSFTTEQIQGPFYHYSHGLKKHNGNCQRIAHGHRSKIEIWINDELAQFEMETWANLWKDIYIGSEQDVIENSSEEISFAYTAQQGQFELSLPRESCYLINTDSTVEYIAEHIATKLKEKFPEKRVKIKAYEGLGKGAIAIR